MLFRVFSIVGLVSFVETINARWLPTVTSMRAYCLDNRFLVFPVDPGLLPNHGQAGGHPHTAGTAQSQSHLNSHTPKFRDLCSKNSLHIATTSQRKKLELGTQVCDNTTTFQWREGKKIYGWRGNLTGNEKFVEFFPEILQLITSLAQFRPHL